MQNRAYPPGPPVLSTIRPLQALFTGNDFSSMPVFLERVAKRYGAIAHWTVFGFRFFSLEDAELIEEVLVTRAGDYEKGPSAQRLAGILGPRSLFTNETPSHLRQRRLLQPAFHRERVAGYGTRMVAETIDQTKAWRDGAVLEVDREMMRLTLSIAAETLFSSNATPQAEAVRRALNDAVETLPMSLGTFTDVMEAFPILPATRRFQKARAQLDAVVYGFIEARRRTSGPPPDDLLAMLLAARDDEGRMDDAEVRDHAITFFLAGHETTSSALGWTWYLLARHPSIAARLQAELDDVLDGRAPEAADIPRLPFTRGVFAEAMRLYPPAWMVVRRALRDTTIGDQVVPRGSFVFASQAVTHRSRKYWDEPDAFRPERWIDETARKPKFAYFPFGGGNRVCIGEPFAWMEGVLLIATIAARFTLQLIDATPVRTQTLVSIRPRTAIRLRVRERQQAARASAAR
jgi:cytochrome P450